MFDRDKFKTRLKQLRENQPKYKTQKEFSDFIEVSQPTLAGYERGTGKPPIDVLCNIAEKCNVSVDWLCGLSDTRTNIDRALSYSDALETLVRLREKISFSVKILPGTDPLDPPDACTFWNSLVALFMKEWEPVYTAFKNGSIKETYYRMIMDDIISKYNVCLDDDQEYLALLDQWRAEQNF